MITRAAKHDINRAGKRLLRAAFESFGWVLNDVEEDYGIDSNVQVFDGRDPTGAWLHVQLKSSHRSKCSADRTFVSQRLSVDHARHYVVDMRGPVLLVHADVAAERVYWYFPQLDKNLAAALRSTTARSITVRIPTCQELPHSASDLVLGLDKVYKTLASPELVEQVSWHSFGNNYGRESDGTYWTVTVLSPS